MCQEHGADMKGQEQEGKRGMFTGTPLTQLRDEIILSIMQILLEQCQ